MDQAAGSPLSLILEFADHGVDHVEYVAALPQPDVWVWLGTASDEERDALLSKQDLLERVRKVLLTQRIGAIEIAGVAVQSAETVERDYAGSWFYTLR